MRILGFDVGWWDAFGFLGTISFTSRFFVQWIASERAKRSVVPISFWWLSILGSSILLVYFIGIRNPVGTLGYLPNLIPYTRNLILIHRHKKALESGGGH